MHPSPRITRINNLNRLIRSRFRHLPSLCRICILASYPHRQFIPQLRQLLVSTLPRASSGTQVPPAMFHRHSLKVLDISLPMVLPIQHLILRMDSISLGSFRHKRHYRLRTEAIRQLESSLLDLRLRLPSQRPCRSIPRLRLLHHSNRLQTHRTRRSPSSIPTYLSNTNPYCRHKTARSKTARQTFLNLAHTLRRRHLFRLRLLLQDIRLSRLHLNRRLRSSNIHNQPLRLEDHCRLPRSTNQRSRQTCRPRTSHLCHLLLSNSNITNLSSTLPLPRASRHHLPLCSSTRPVALGPCPHHSPT